MKLNNVAQWSVIGGLFIAASTPCRDDNMWEQPGGLFERVENLSVLAMFNIQEQIAEDRKVVGAISADRGETWRIMTLPKQPAADQDIGKYDDMPFLKMVVLVREGQAIGVRSVDIPYSSSSREEFTVAKMNLLEETINSIERHLNYVEGGDVRLAEFARKVLEELKHDMDKSDE